MKKLTLALLLLLVPLAMASERLDFGGGVSATVTPPSGWETYQDTPGDYYYFLEKADGDLLAVINIYAGENLGMSTGEILAEFGNDAGAMLHEMHEGLVEAIRQTSGEYNLRFGDDAAGDDPTWFVMQEYNDNWDGIEYYNLDTMLLYDGVIIYMDAYCLDEYQGPFLDAVIAFLDSMRF